MEPCASTSRVIIYTCKFVSLRDEGNIAVLVPGCFFFLASAKIPDRQTHLKRAINYVVARFHFCSYVFGYSGEGDGRRTKMIIQANYETDQSIRVVAKCPLVICVDEEPLEERRQAAHTLPI